MEKRDLGESGFTGERWSSVKLNALSGWEGGEREESNLEERKGTTGALVCVEQLGNGT